MGKRGKQLSQTKKEMIVQVFALTGNKSRTAQELGVSRPSIHQPVRSRVRSPAIPR